MQSILTPPAGRLADVLDRKWMAAIPSLFAFVGAIVSARATAMSQLIGGGILLGMTLPATGIMHAIQAEVMPLKHRPLSFVFTGIGVVVGGLWVEHLPWLEYFLPTLTIAMIGLAVCVLLRLRIPARVDGAMLSGLRLACMERRFWASPSSTGLFVGRTIRKCRLNSISGSLIPLVPCYTWLERH